MRTKLLPLLLFLLAGATCLSAQTLSFFETFTDHAVLQRGVEHPLWGWAAPGRRVTVTFGREVLKTRAKRDGRWKVVLPRTEAGGPYTVTAAAGRERLILADVYFGDVYLLSGQSNMEWQLRQSDPDSSRARSIADPLIRELKVQRTYDNAPRTHLPTDPQSGSEWRLGSERIGDFSAVGSYFAHYLRREVDVPIGLLHASWGGSRIEPWLSAETLGGTAERGRAERENVLARAGHEGEVSFNRNFPGRELPTEDRGEQQGWLKPDHDDVSWPTMALPTLWETAGYPRVDGYFYFRKTFMLTEAQAKGGATLYLGAIDDGDWTYLNGQRVGSTPNAYSEDRQYRIEPGVLRAGANKIAIRVFDGGGGGGFSAPASGMYLETRTGQRVSLAGDYKYNIGQFRVDVQPNQVPTILYNAMIAPLKGYPLTGVLWYQGESNASPGDNIAYANLKKLLITSWRDFFDHDELPFYWVQLANFMDPVSTPDEPGWAVLRQSQTAALDLPRTGQAVITDIGEADDIHPRNKWEVGRRLSLFALRDIYRKEVYADSPSVDEVRSTSMGDARVLTFKDVGGGLTVKSNDRYGYPTGFTVQDEAGRWHFAQALLDPHDNTVVVMNPAGTGIRTIRYNWANNPDGNLYSKEGLPVTAFEVAVE